MDQLAAKQGGPGAWPTFGEVDIAAIANAMGCESRRIGTEEEVRQTFDEVMPGLRERETPLLLEVEVEPD
jgi:benzoylformate decarboxylase